MKQLRKDLQAVSKNLKALTEKTEKMINSVDTLEKRVKSAPTVRRTAVKKPVNRGRAARKRVPSATDVVLKVINRSKKGVNTATLQDKTGYNSRKIWDIVHRAYKEGKIKKLGRGTYGRA